MSLRQFGQFIGMILMSLPISLETSYSVHAHYDTQVEEGLVSTMFYEIKFFVSPKYPCCLTTTYKG